VDPDAGWRIRDDNQRRAAIPIGGGVALARRRQTSVRNRVATEKRRP
jgi:hypothetical protein